MRLLQPVYFKRYPLRFEHYSSLDSTNTQANRFAQTGELGPMWISADIQTSGKGRRGRQWVSDTGNLYCTGLYPHPRDIGNAARLSFAAALSVVETLEHYIDPDLIKIKWPNDVLVDNAKIAGILLESGSYEGTIWVAMGIGINLVSSPRLHDRDTIYLAHYMSTEKKMNAQTILHILADKFDYWRGEYLQNGFASVRNAWLAKSIGIGGPVTARLLNQQISGTAIGMDSEGALEIKTKNGKVVKIHVGDVFFS